MARPGQRASWSDRLKLRRWDFWTGFTLFMYAFLLVVVVYPLCALLISSLYDKQGDFTFANYWDFLRLKYYRNALLNSFKLSSLSALFALLIGVPLAYVSVRTDIRGKGALNILVIMSLLSPPFIGAYSWIMMLGNNGFLKRILHAAGIPFTSIYGPKGIVFVLALQFYPHIYLYVSGALRMIDTSLEEAAESLGVPAWKRIWTITLPLILPTLSAGTLMVFMESFADFGTPLLLGQGYKVMPVLAYDQFISEMGSNPAMASTVSGLMIVCATLILFIQRFVSTRRNYAMTGMRTPTIRSLPPAVRRLVTALAFVPAGISIIPQATVAVTSFIETKGPVFQRGFSMGSYAEIWYRVKQAIMNTYSFSLLAIAAMIVLGVLTAYVLVRRKSRITAMLDGLIMVPYVIPGTVLGISFILAFNKPPLLLTGTWIILVLAYVTRKMSYTIRSSSGILQQLDKSVEEASISLGVPPVPTFFKTTLVLMLPGVLSGAIISWVAVINELSTTIVLYHGATATIAVSVYSEVVTSNYGTGAALATILSVTALLSLLIANRLSGRKLML
ncbi:ABC transporter permease [Paenibacillus glycinis]|uniref:ABC transporter permease subunit n=1 Tax=Paenibacillus glycinis TaxID=2697035 RepID=A0ABW9XNC2_9BACL|nr:iron ABC transporter permease [Paenibacillus glycinis]NBD24142.1 ABC transporter permease subunit [Paenibacillus glycinis]